MDFRAMPKSAKSSSGSEKRRPKRHKKSGTKKVAGAARELAIPEIAPAKALELDLQTLLLLSAGDWSQLADLEWPPPEIRRWLAKTDIRQVRGLLLMTLDRWHGLDRDSKAD
jgi:hypothetical protein